MGGRSGRVVLRGSLWAGRFGPVTLADRLGRVAGCRRGRETVRYLMVVPFAEDDHRCAGVAQW